MGFVPNWPHTTTNALQAGKDLYTDIDFHLSRIYFREMNRFKKGMEHLAQHQASTHVRATLTSLS